MWLAGVDLDELTLGNQLDDVSVRPDHDRLPDQVAGH